MKTLFQILTVFSATLFLVTSCSKEEVNVTDVENYINESVFGLEKQCNAGKMGCFEIVWPLSIIFPDGTSGTYEDQDALRSGIQSWKEANPDASERPGLSFPVDIVDEEGTLFTILDQEDLRSVVRECRRTYFGNHSHRGHPRNSCFSIVFPLSIDFSDDGVVEFQTKEELKTALRDWRDNNPSTEVRPSFLFPINVVLKETQEQVSVGSAEDLVQLKEDCRG